MSLALGLDPRGSFYLLPLFTQLLKHKLEIKPREP